jgi:hypothetical protein
MKTFATLTPTWGVNGDLSAFETDDGDDEESADSDAADYLVDVKRSARKASAEAGAWVRDNGTHHRFDSKPQARSWARDLSGDRTVWVQDAHPKDDAVDGYVVARRCDPERSRAREQTTATAQTSLDTL